MKHLKRIKKSLLIVFFAVQTIFIQAQSDTTYTGNITVTTQAQVDALGDTLAGKTIIDGNLNIGYTDFGSTRSDVTDLAPLSNIVHITGGVWIQQNEQLVNLNALNNLQTIGGFFQVNNNDSLTTLGDFPNLQSIGGGFSVSSNDKLTAVGDFPDLQSIEGSFFVFGNDTLTTLGDFSELQTIGGYFSVQNNDQLTTLGDFPALQSIDVEMEAAPTSTRSGTVRTTGSYTLQGNFTITVSGNNLIISFTDDFVADRRLPRLVLYLTNNPNSPAGGKLLGNVETFSGAHEIVLEGVGLFDYNYLFYYCAPFSIKIGHGEALTPDTGRDNVSIVVENNPSLSDCSVLTEFLPGGATAVSGGIYINSNATRCNSQNDIISTVYRSDITVTTQAEVDTLSTTLAGKTRIDGNLTIGYTLDRDSLSSSNITNLTPLSNIVHITGGVWIQQNGQLDNINALNNLQTIGEYFYVDSNDTLTTLGDFSVLDSIGGFFQVNSNAKLTTLGDFPALQTIGGDFNVFLNADLTTLGDFSALQTIGGDFHVSYNDQLRTLGNFLILNSIGEEFEVFNNDQLTTLGDFPALRSIGGPFLVFNNAKLTDLGYFSNLQTIGGYFSVSNNDTLTTLGDFTALQTIGGYFSVSNNDTLTTLGDFTALQTIGGYFSVSNNDTLTTLGDFTALQSIGGYFNVFNNNILTSLDNFSNLQSIGGYFEVYDNDILTTFGDFSALDSIGEYFDVSFNDRLRTLGDFPNLTSIGIGSAYVPSEEGQYTDSVSIVVESNPNLVLCSWLESFLPTGSNAVMGDIYIQDNATGCETTEEIKNPPPVLLAENRIISHKDSTTTSFNIYANVRWQLATSDDATWITSLSSGSSTHSSRITGENEATITLMHTRAPNETPRSTTLTLTAIDENSNELTNPATMTINFTQLSTFYKGDITLRNQEEVDEFISNTTLIDGNLTIGYTDFSSQSDITDLTPLRNITDITGNLRIQQNGQLNNITDLNNLQTIGGYFRVRNNDQLTTLGYFSVLQSIGGYFSVWQNSNLSSLGDFPDLQSIGGYFNVNRHSELTTLGYFPVLQSIGGYFSVWQNSNLFSLGDFPVLQSIGEDFGVSNNDQLMNLGDFPTLQTVGGYFRVRNNDQLTTLSNFPALQSIGGFFRVSDNDQLRTLGDFPTLMSIGIGETYVPSLNESRDNVSIVIEENLNLGLCSWVESFLPTETHAVTGDIYINYNATGCETTEEINNRLPVLSVKNRIFSHKDSTTTSFNIYANVRWKLVTSDDATWITSLSSGSSTHSSRITGENEATITLIHTRAPNETPRSTTLTLTAMDEEGEELTNPASMTIHFTQLSTFYDGSITLESQEEVNEFISNTTVILGTLTIGYTDDGDSRSNITNLVPLRNITDITGNLRIEQNGSLVNLNALNNLQTIGGYFRVIRNDTLTNLGSFPNLTSIGISTFDVYVPSLDEDRDSVSIMVESNPRLSDCCVLANFLNQENNRVEGNIFITNNATGCDRNTIQNICHTLIVTTNKNHQIAYDSTDPIPIIFTVGGSAIGWTSAITYTPADASFITLSPTEGTEITTAITLMATPTENTGVERTAMIILTTTGMGTPATQMIVITQQSPPTIMLSTSNQTIAHNSTDPIGISFMVGGSATGWKSAITYTPASANFITLDTNMNDNQTGAITLMATPTENTGVERTATITLTTTGMGAPVSVSLTITQEVRAALSTHTKESIFIFYPNPTKGKLTVEGVTGYLQMYIHDLVGREVMTYSLTPSKKTIDVSNLPSGMYVVTLQAENKTWTEVLIIVN